MPALQEHSQGGPGRRVHKLGDPVPRGAHPHSASTSEQISPHAGKSAWCELMYSNLARAQLLLPYIDLSQITGLSLVTLVEISHTSLAVAATL